MRGFQGLCSQSDQFLPLHSDKKFSALGFGARIPPNYEVSQGTCVKQDQWGQKQWLGGGQQSRGILVPKAAGPIGEELGQCSCRRLDLQLGELPSHHRSCLLPTSPGISFYLPL